MKNRVVLLAVLLGAIFAAACEGDTQPSATVTTVEPTATAPTVGPTATQVTDSSAMSDTPAPDVVPEPSPDPNLERFAAVPGIVDSTNHSWPRTVDGLNGRITISAKPQRIINASVGHAEITFALVPASRVVGVGGATQDAVYSNVASMAVSLPVITQDPETIVAQNPDVIVTSPYFPTDSVDALERVGIPVIQTELSNDPSSRVHDILLLGYIFGEEERALALADEVQARYEGLLSVLQASTGPQPRVIALTRYSDTVWTAGAGATEGAIIEAAGAINAAAEAGIQSNQPTSFEGIIAMAPEVIIIPQPAEFGANEFLQDLIAHPALADVPAVRDGRVHLVEGRHFTTLSFWNLIGVERLGQLLWPDVFAGGDSEAFSLPEVTR